MDFILKLLFYILLLFLIIIMGTCVIELKNNPRTEEIKILAVGELINIRATGDFGIYNTELKFKDGSMLLVTYSFSRCNNLKIGIKYKIWYSSFYDYQCKEMK